MEMAILQLSAVIVGGLLATAGGILTTLIIERQRRAHESKQLAMAFKGEIGALLQHVEERDYLGRISEVVDQIQYTGEPFSMRMRLRFKYDRVYENNLERLGLLKPPLPERIPLFYTRLNSILEDFINLAEGAYDQLELDTLLRIYRDLYRLMEKSLVDGKSIISEIDRLYGEW